MQKLIKFSALALMTVIVLLCTTVLLLLIWSTAASSRAATDRYAAAVKQEYRLEAEGQEWLATSPVNTDAVIGDAKKRHLEVAVDSAGAVTRWQLIPRQTTANPGIKNLFKGN